MGKLGCQGTLGWGLVECSGWRRHLEGPAVGLVNEIKLTAPKPFSCRTQMAFALLGMWVFFTPFGQKGKHTSLFYTPHQSLRGLGKVLVLPLAMWQHT